MLVKLGQVDSQFASYTAEKGGGSSPVMIHNLIASMVNSERYNGTVRIKLLWSASGDWFSKLSEHDSNVIPEQEEVGFLTCKPR
jgi:hypothetical protein